MTTFFIYLGIFYLVTFAWMGYEIKTAPLIEDTELLLKMEGYSQKQIDTYLFDVKQRGQSGI